MTFERIIIAAETLIILFGLGFLLSTKLKSAKQAEGLSLQDDLTGDLNREAMMKLGAIVMEESRVHHRTFSAGMLDADNFRIINETFGAQIGDQVLKQLSHVIQEQKRKHDKASRWRGEGWLVLFPDSPANECIVFFERLQKALYDTSFPIPDEWTMTMSMGIAEYHEDDKTFDDVLKRADTALVKAKQSGKNRVEVYRYHKQAM